MSQSTSSVPSHALSEGTVFVVNVIHAHPGKQAAAHALIREIVEYVAERRKEFLWSTLATSVVAVDRDDTDDLALCCLVGMHEVEPLQIPKY